MEDISRIYSNVMLCKKCPEYYERHKFAPLCHGNGRRGLMIVGESSYKPSIDAGRYYAQGSVRSLLSGIVDLEKDCYLSDAIKCAKEYSTANGTILDKIAQRCSVRFLKKEVEFLRPKAVLAVGRIAFECLTDVRGDFISRQNDGNRYFAFGTAIPVFPIIHPSNANRLYGRVPRQNDTYRQNVVLIVNRCLDF